MIEFDKLRELIIDYENLPTLIELELDKNGNFRGDLSAPRERHYTHVLILIESYSPYLEKNIRLMHKDLRIKHGT